MATPTGKERVYLVGGGRTYDLTLEQLKDYLSTSGVDVTIADISDAGAAGAAILAAGTQVQAQRAAGATDIGVGVFTATNQLMAATAIGTASTTVRGCVLQGAAVANSAATDVAGVNTVLNALLASLRASGAIAS